MTEVREHDQFSSHEPLLWRVLSALARNGYLAPPDEGRDLIHDFFVEAWPGVLTRFDGTLSAFTTYLSAAFYKFARRRIVNLQNWRYRLVDVDALADHESLAITPVDEAELNEQIELIRRALTRLPPREREVLYAYVANEGYSERALAERFSLTRYALREALANAVGHLAAEVGGLPNANTLEAKVVECVWRRGHSARTTAAQLGVSLPEVHAAKTKFATEVLEALRSYHAPFSIGRLKVNPSIELLREALLSPGSKTLLKKVHENSSEILAALDGVDRVLTASDMEKLVRHRDWVAQVYASLAATGEDQASESERAVVLAMQALRSSEGQEIGEAFAALLANVDEELRVWTNWFAGVPTPDDGLMATLKADKSVAAGMPYSGELLAFGITPLMVHQGTRGLQLLMDRGRRSARGRAAPFIAENWLSARAESDQAFRLDLDVGAFFASVPLETAVAQVAGVRYLHRKTARPLLDWTLALAKERPYLVNGYVFDASDKSFRKDETWTSSAEADDSESKLMARWSSRLLESAN